MGCFLGCFGASKDRRRQRRREHGQPRGSRISEGASKNDHLAAAKVPMVEEVSNVSQNPSTDLYEKVEGKCNQSPTRKRVTFDSNVKTYEHILPDESVEFPKDKEEKPVKSSQIHSSPDNSSVTSNSSGSFPPNHRYQNCRESDDEEEDGIESDESDLDDIDDEDGFFDEDYYSDGDGYYNQAKEVYAEEVADNGLDIEEIEAEPRGSNASARDRSGYVHSVLNPVENLTQWKAVKSKQRTIPRQSQKENLNLVCDQEDKRGSFGTEPWLDESRDEPKKTKNQEFAVDASLSTWLSSSETASACKSVSMGFEATIPEKNTSCNSTPIKDHDERPILGALTVEEIRKFSAISSPSKSPDEMPIIGSVGSYWNHSGSGKDHTSSKYREDKRVNWKSTPFEARLERGLNS